LSNYNNPLNCILNTMMILYPYRTKARRLFSILSDKSQKISNISTIMGHFNRPDAPAQALSLALELNSDQKMNPGPRFGRYDNRNNAIANRFSEHIMMTDDQIIQWMRSRVKETGFTDATSLAESFLREYHIHDALDPVFSRSLDVSFKVAQEIRDQKMLAIAG